MDASFTYDLPQRTVLAGSSTGSPADSPTMRLDTQGAASPYNFVGALQVSSGTQIYYGSASAISPHWVLTAAHNVDYDDDGAADAGLSVQFKLPDYGSFTATSTVVHPDFSGFGNPTVNDDLALLYFASPLPETLILPRLGILGIGDTATMVGFGRSGYGDLGYTTAATTTQRRVGQNVIDTFRADDEGSGRSELFEYDFDDVSTVGLMDGSLGNDLESLIGPGDSGGPLLALHDGSYEIVGINTYLMGSSGTFGTIGGGILTKPYEDWISGVTGLAFIPEAHFSPAIFLAAFACIVWRRFTLFSR